MAYSKNRRLAEIVSDTSGNLSVEGIVVPTQSSSDNDTSAASTAFVHAHIDAVLDSAPGTLNTLNEIAAALNDDANFNTTITNSIAAKLPLAGGTMTGAIAAADFEVDASGDINLDAGGGDWRLKDDGTTIATISNLSGDLQILLGQDKDYKFNIDDNGSQSTALLLDGSEAGAATFNSTINGLTLAAGGISGPATQNFALNTPHSLRINIDSDNNATDQDFIIGNNQTAVNQSNVLFKVQENGNVGIGTTSPDSKLHVHGVGTLLSSDSYFVAQIQTDRNDDGSNDDGILQFVNGSSKTVKGEIRFDESTNTFELGHGDNQNHLVIGASGQIGIGGENYGTDGQILTSTGASSAPAWEDAPASGPSKGLAIAFSLIF